MAPPSWRARLRGPAGQPMDAGAKRAFLTLLVISFALAGANLEFTAREVGASRAAAASVVQLCQAGNTARAQQVALWDHLITISKPPPGETPAQQRQRLAMTRVFAAYVHHVFAPVNCTRRY